MATKEITTAVIKLELENFTLTAEGILDEITEWTITHSSPVSTTSYVRREYWDEEDATDFLWEEADYIIRKYSTVTVDYTIDEIEEEED
jgi:hypothetical protein